jgi:ketosteroid isomerase-like protein
LFLVIFYNKEKGVILKKTIKYFSLFILLFILKGVSADCVIYSQYLCLDSLRIKIDNVNRILDEASRNFDYETMSAYYEDDVLILPNGEPIIQGKTAFIENEKKTEQAGYKILGIETANIDIFFCDGFVHEVGSYKVTLKVPNVTFDIIDKGKYLVVWKIFSDGSIKIKLEMWNNDEMNR